MAVFPWQTIASRLIEHDGSTFAYEQDTVTMNSIGDVTSRTAHSYTVTAYLSDDIESYMDKAEATELGITTIGLMVPLSGLTPNVGDFLTDGKGRKSIVEKVQSQDAQGNVAFYILGLKA